MSSLYHSQATRNYEKCKSESKKLWGRAKLDKSFDALKEKGIMKPTEGDREAFADLDPDYLAMKEGESYWKALSFFLWTKVETFQSAHDDAKKIYSQTEDPRGSVSSMPSTKENYRNE